VGYSSWKAQTGSTPFGAARRRLDLPGKGRRSVTYISPEQRAGEPEDRNSAGYRRPGSRCRACVTYTHESDQHVHRQLLEIRVRPTQSESRKRERVTQKVEVVRLRGCAASARHTSHVGELGSLGIDGACLAEARPMGERRMAPQVGLGTYNPLVNRSAKPQFGGVHTESQRASSCRPFNALRDLLLWTITTLNHIVLEQEGGQKGGQPPTTVYPC
jgi:hypothetical protein